ncbi:hypothetical protein [Verrucosispora sioxanthis]|nr:hypothetical protein [Verrucosispora sioxanthis]
MRERVLALGGSFTACPTADDGYAIDALLPADPPPSDEPEDGTS